MRQRHRGPVPARLYIARRYSLPGMACHHGCAGEEGTRLPIGGMPHPKGASCREIALPLASSFGVETPNDRTVDILVKLRHLTKTARGIMGVNCYRVQSL